jgi:hypothetical protein
MKNKININDNEEKELLNLKIKVLEKEIELEKLVLEKLKFNSQETKPKMSEVCDSVENTEDSSKSPIYEDKTPDISFKLKQLSQFQQIPEKKKFSIFKKKEKCPLCNSKLKKGKVIKGDDLMSMKQIIKCKNPSCSYLKEYNF